MRFDQIYVHFILQCCIGAAIGLSYPLKFETMTTTLYGLINVIGLLGIIMMNFVNHGYHEEIIKMYMKQIMVMQFGIHVPYLCDNFPKLMCTWLNSQDTLTPVWLMSFCANEITFGLNKN